MFMWYREKILVNGKCKYGFDDKKYPTGTQELLKKGKYM